MFVPWFRWTTEQSWVDNMRKGFLGRLWMRAFRFLFWFPSSIPTLSMPNRSSTCAKKKTEASARASTCFSSVSCGRFWFERLASPAAVLLRGWVSRYKIGKVMRNYEVGRLAIRLSYLRAVLSLVRFAPDI